MPTSKRTAFERKEGLEREGVKGSLTDKELQEEILKLISLYDENGWMIHCGGISRKDAKRRPDCEMKPITFTDDCRITVIRKCMGIIPLLVSKTSTKALTNSYGLKHVLEDTIVEKYVSNAEAIIAMLLLGHRISLPEPSSKWNPNCNFFCKYTKCDYLTTRQNPFSL